MADVTQLLDAAAAGDAKAAAELLPLVYDELRRLAAQKLAQEKPGQTLQATALVHEAYMRLAGAEKSSHWKGRGHFFAAAAEAMRRILVEQARRKNRLRYGDGRVRQELAPELIAAPETPEDVLRLNDALDRLAATSEQAAALVKFRFFAGLTNEQAAVALEVSPRKANQIWAYARAWLREDLEASPG
jgi:RNA polymerase sigma factor (TIGR02999 family)